MAGRRPLMPARRSVGMARRSAGTGARTPTASPPGARPAGPCRSGPAPARPPWRPSAARATTTDVVATPGRARLPAMRSPSYRGPRPERRAGAPITPGQGRYSACPRNGGGGTRRASRAPILRTSGTPRSALFCALSTKQWPLFRFPGESRSLLGERRPERRAGPALFHLAGELVHVEIVPPGVDLAVADLEGPP